MLDTHKSIRIWRAILLASSAATAVIIIVALSACGGGGSTAAIVASTLPINPLGATGPSTSPPCDPSVTCSQAPPTSPPCNQGAGTCPESTPPGSQAPLPFCQTGQQEINCACPQGTQATPASGNVCVVPPVPQGCPAPEVVSPSTGQCVPPPAPPSCAQGLTNPYDSSVCGCPSGDVVVINNVSACNIPPPPCANGATAGTQACVCQVPPNSVVGGLCVYPVATPPPPTCEAPAMMVNGSCVTPCSTLDPTATGNVPNCVCPAGEVWDQGTCITPTAPCPNGSNTYPSCVCPVGQVYNVGANTCDVPPADTLSCSVVTDPTNGNTTTNCTYQSSVPGDSCSVFDGATQTTPSVNGQGNQSGTVSLPAIFNTTQFVLQCSQSNGVSVTVTP